eukprot:7903616-Alexandrium_andersonii.AAC.1
MSGGGPSAVRGRAAKSSPRQARARPEGHSWSARPGLSQWHCVGASKPPRPRPALERRRGAG